jgi:hypothetical protein
MAPTEVRYGAALATLGRGAALQRHGSSLIGAPMMPACHVGMPAVTSGCGEPRHLRMAAMVRLALSHAGCGS